MNNILKIAVFVSVFIFSAVTVFCQKTIVSGKVYDAETKEPLPYVNVAFKDSKIGTITDENGNYRIETYYATDSLIASFIGYQRMAKKVKKDQAQIIDFPLTTGSIQLQEVVIKYKKEENPAHPIIRNVIKYKKVNNREKLDAYQYEVYNKVEFDINNIDEE
ncbi:MAG: carboxypeptidase-like regulatory domain-containing protein, partial [Bacteroidetes bacterium]